MTFDPVEFIRAQTVIGAPSIIPEIKLHLAAEVTPLWQLTEEMLKGSNMPPPFWAFAWPGGQGLARYMLDHPEVAAGKRILDLAAGSGIASIAAMKAGAKQALATDIDALALHSIALNAALNNVTVATGGEPDLTRAPKNTDLIIAGDICYQQAMAARLMRWLWLCVGEGIRVLIADPGRAYVPHEGLHELARYKVPTSKDIEEQEERMVVVWELGVGDLGLGVGKK